MSDDVYRLARSLAYAYAVAGYALPDGDRMALASVAGDTIDRDALDSHMEAGHEVGVRRRNADLAAKAADTNDEHWPEMIALPKRPRVPTMEPDYIPECIRDYVVDVAMRACLPIETVAVPAIVGLSSLVGCNVRVRPDTQSRWTTPPNLWGAIVARPGLMKSHAISAALKPIAWLANNASEQHRMQERANKARKIALESQLVHLKRLKDPDPLEIENLIESIDSLDAKERRYRTNDPTVEKLGELLIENPRGLLLVRDELGGWLASMRRSGREGDREFYVEAWNGDSSYTVDRIGRGTLHIPSLCLSIVGALQPGKLRSHVAGALAGGAEADGLLQRLQLLVWPDSHPQWNRCDGEPDESAQRRAAQAFYDLDELCAERWADPVVFTDQAQQRYDAWRDAHEVRLRSKEFLQTPAFEAHLGKYRGLLPSLALLFWLLGPRSVGRIGVAEFALAERWCVFLEAHARKLYEPEIYVGFSTARAMAKRIKDGSVEHGMSVRDVQRSKWSGLTSPEAVSAALEELKTLGWVRVVPVKTGSRSRTEIRLHPELRGL